MLNPSEMNKYIKEIKRKTLVYKNIADPNDKSFGAVSLLNVFFLRHKIHVCHITLECIGDLGRVISGRLAS